MFIKCFKSEAAFFC